VDHAAPVRVDPFIEFIEFIELVVELGIDGSSAR